MSIRTSELQAVQVLTPLDPTGTLQNYGVKGVGREFFVFNIIIGISLIVAACFLAL